MALKISKVFSIFKYIKITLDAKSFVGYAIIIPIII